MAKLAEIVPQDQQLEINKLDEVEEQANKDGDFDNLYQYQEELDEEADKLKEEDDAAEGIDEDSSQESDPDEVAADEETAEDVQPEQLTQEMFRELNFDAISCESYELFEGELSDVLRGLAMLGISALADITGKVFKHTLVLMFKLVKLLFASIVSLANYIDNHFNSFSNLKQEVAELRDQALAIKRTQPHAAITDQSYTNKRVIDILKIGNNTHFDDNIVKLSKFIDTAIRDITDRIMKDINILYHISSLSFTKSSVSPNALMKVEPPAEVYRKVAQADEGENTTLTYSYKDRLPGDLQFLFSVPNNNVINNIDDVVSAYNNISMSLVVDADSFQSVESVNYMNIDELIHFLDKLDKLCEVCLSHQANYKQVEKQKLLLRHGFKNYFLSIINFEGKASNENSLIKYYYLKYVAMDKVYLKASVDLHDYSKKVLLNGLTLVRHTLDEY